MARSEDIADAGAFVLLDSFGESIIVLRGDDGAARAFYNVCRHRGARLCERETGHFAGAIVCPYHAWTFALDGSLAAARNMAGAPGFSKDDYPLEALAVEEYGGCIFLNFAAEASARVAPRVTDYLAPLARKFERWNLAGLRRARRASYAVAANWKLIAQNYSECYHCPVVHPQLDELSAWDSGSNDLRLVDADDLRRVYYYSLFPTLLLSLHPDYVMLHRIVPLGVANSIVHCEWLFAPEAIAAPGFDPSDVVAFWELTNRQDWHVCELSQSGIDSRAYKPGPYSGYESMLAAYDDHYRAVMEL